MNRGRGRPPLDLDERAVLRAALEAFAEGGPVGTSMERVAEVCGVAKTTLHDRFGSKADIFEKAISQERTALAEHLLAAYAAGEHLDAREQIRNGYVAFFDYAREHPAGFRMLFGGAEQSAPTVPQAGRAVVVDAVTALVRGFADRAGIELARSAEIVADVIVGAGEYLGRRLVAEPDLDVDAATHLVTDIVAGGALGAFPAGVVRFDRADAG